MTSCVGEMRQAKKACLMGEIECNIIIFDHKNKRVRISQRAPVIIDTFAELSKSKKSVCRRGSILG